MGAFHFSKLGDVTRQLWSQMGVGGGVGHQFEELTTCIMMCHSFDILQNGAWQFPESTIWKLETVLQNGSVH